MRFTAAGSGAACHEGTIHSRSDTRIGSNCDWVRLHPVLFGDFFDGPWRHPGQTGRDAGSCKQRSGIGIGFEQGYDTGTVPAGGDERTRLAELWLLVRSSGVGILNAGRERPDIQQGIAHRFGM